MGASQGYFTAEELQDYQDLTYLSKTEILHVFKRFKGLSEQVENVNSSGRDARRGGGGGGGKKEYVLPVSAVTTLDELRNNPFADRICKVFSSSSDGVNDGDNEEGEMMMTFEDFLDMMSVFSDNAPKQIKVEYAFKIYDFDEDDMLGRGDLEQTINRLTGSHLQPDRALSPDNITVIIDRILDESDLDGDEELSFAEFEHVISKSPDFINSFRIRL